MKCVALGKREKRGELGSEGPSKGHPDVNADIYVSSKGLAVFHREGGRKGGRKCKGQLAEIKERAEERSPR